MGPVVVAAIITGTVGLIVAVVQILGGRDSRGQAQKEADVLSKLAPDSEAARQLRQIIEQRVARWHRRLIKPEPKPKPERRDHLAEALAESFKLRTGPTPRWVWFVVGFVSLGVLTLGVIGALNDHGDGQLCLVNLLGTC